MRRRRRRRKRGRWRGSSTSTSTIHDDLFCSSLPPLTPPLKYTLTLAPVGITFTHPHPPLSPRASPLPFFLYFYYIIPTTRTTNNILPLLLDTLGEPISCFLLVRHHGHAHAFTLRGDGATDPLEIEPSREFGSFRLRHVIDVFGRHHAPHLPAGTVYSSGRGRGRRRTGTGTGTGEKAGTTGDHPRGLGRVDLEVVGFIGVSPHVAFQRSVGEVILGQWGVGGMW